jgi:hypothetical protein
MAAAPKRKLESLDALEALEGEVLDPDGSVEVPLGDEKVRVKPLNEWRSSATRALREGDFDTWAEKCLAGDDYETWSDLDPTLAEVEDFFTAWGKLSGQDSGKSRASRRSSNGTARR